MELVVNFDQTGLHIVPTGGTRTYAVKGSKEVRLIGQDDKRQIKGAALETLSLRQSYHAAQ